MSLAEVWGVVPAGISGVMVKVEVDVARGLPSVGVVGLAHTSVAEARWRARSAIVNSGFTWPNSRITIGLSPADLPKTGTSLDLPIAVGLLAATEQISKIESDISFIGELGLDGAIKPVAGVLAAAITAQRHGITTFIVSAGNSREASQVSGLSIIAVTNLRQLITVLRGETAGEKVEQSPDDAHHANALGDFSEVRGHEAARFALEVAAAGGHHCSMLGEPGVGKTMLAQRFVSLLPELSDQQALDVTAVHALAGRIHTGHGLLRRPPFIAPHHSISAGAMLGTMRNGVLLPGALTLASEGVLFLDEAPEFDRPCLEGMRQPLEQGSLALMRVGQTVIAPARFQLLLAANPCPCGQGIGRGDGCTCGAQQKRRYLQKLSGPLMDRIDIRISLTRPTDAHLRMGVGETSDAIAQRVLLARDRAQMRWDHESWGLNSQAPGSALRASYPPNIAGQVLLERAEAKGLNPRGSDRVLRMAWTLADLEAKDQPGNEHVATALSMRGGGFE